MFYSCRFVILRNSNLENKVYCDVCILMSNIILIHFLVKKKEKRKLSALRVHDLKY